MTPGTSSLGGTRGRDWTVEPAQRGGGSGARTRSAQGEGGPDPGRARRTLERRLVPKQKQPKVERGGGSRLGEAVHGCPLEKRENRVPQSRAAGLLPSCGRGPDPALPGGHYRSLPAAGTTAGRAAARPGPARSPAPRPLAPARSPHGRRGPLRHRPAPALPGSPPARPASCSGRIRGPPAPPAVTGVRAAGPHFPVPLEN